MIEDSARSGVPAQTQPQRAEPELYDFGRPATLSREHARVLDLSFETFARQWATQLSARTRGRVQISVGELSMLTYDEYADSLPQTTMVVTFSLPGVDSRGILQFPVSTAVDWIVQMLGGRHAPQSPDRVLTHIEQALMRALAGEAVDTLTLALGGLLPAGASVAGIHYSVPFAQAAAAGDLVIVSRLELRLGDDTVAASIVLPAPVILAGFSAQGEDVAPMPPGLMQRQVEATPVEVALRLTTRTTRPSEVLNLAVGDVIHLPHAADRPLELVVDDQVVASAAVGTSGARLACVVTAASPAPVPESVQEPA